MTFSAGRLTCRPVIEVREQRVARWREAGWGRGAFCVWLAYAFVLQLFVAGIAHSSARGGVAMANAHPMRQCPVRRQYRQFRTTPPMSPQADHSVCCALCAFHSLAPILPVAADAGRPVATPAISERAAVAAAEGTGRVRREPRSSQGPPHTRLTPDAFRRPNPPRLRGRAIACPARVAGVLIQVQPSRFIPPGGRSPAGATKEHPCPFSISPAVR